jgi:hypothetical protein
MNRRGFLRLFSAAAATVAIDPERLLWVPGTKKIFIPKPVQVVSILDQTAWARVALKYRQNGGITMSSPIMYR